jgi:opacity protein-like surface antigen
MRFRGPAIVSIILASLLASHNLLAEDGSRIAIKINFGGNVFTSTEKLTTGYYPAIDDAGIFDASNQMEYKFDPNFGKSFYGALCYRTGKIIELELGAGYTSVPMEISQVSNYSFSGSSGYIIDSYEYELQKDANFRYVNIRPAVTFFVPTNSSVAPYFSVGMNIMMMKAKGSLDFAMSYVTEDASYYYLWIGPDAHLEPLAFEGSQTAFALDLGGGLEFKVTPMLSIDLGAAYLIQLQRGFKEFDEILENQDARDVFRMIGYDFNGLDYSNFNFSLGLKMHFQ